MNIAFDIDGCVLNVMPRMEWELGKSGIEILNYNEYWIKTNPMISDLGWIDLWQNVFEDYKQTPPYPGAIDFLTTLHAKAQQPIHFITSRNIRHATATHEAIKHYLKCPFTISFANRPFKKLDYLNDYEWMVDDNPHEVAELLKHGKLVIMPKRPWNKSLDYHVNYELSEMGKFIDEIFLR